MGMNSRTQHPLAIACAQIDANIDWSPAHRDQAMKLLALLKAQHGAPLLGRTRAVYVTSQGHVIKVALNDEGESANHNEARASTLVDSFIPVATCHLELISDIQVLIMETVAHVGYHDGEPDWVSWVDCGQVGTTQDGRLVAYDL